MKIFYPLFALGVLLLCPQVLEAGSTLPDEPAQAAPSDGNRQAARNEVTVRVK